MWLCKQPAWDLPEQDRDCLLTSMYSHQHPYRQRSQNPWLQRSSWLLRRPCRRQGAGAAATVALTGRHGPSPSWWHHTAFHPGCKTVGRLDPNCLQEWPLNHYPSVCHLEDRGGDTWKTLLKFYSVNQCLVFHVGQRSRFRCIRAIIREKGGVGIEVSTLPDNHRLSDEPPLLIK